MRLKCIKLAGFKSFVDPTTVNFPSNLCAVVGPNGCGKSNIIDAVRWVMGESSAKNLRGESMTDVIFNGSNGRKPVGQASIELVFDNTAKTLKGEYAAYNEISIKRKVTRDSQNIYYLNGTKCRRRDITDIFLGTGLGPRSYAIIEQGMISKLIEARPEDLRVFIEEAAGISKYKERRRDTESRMRRTHENLERLTDIRDELERQLSRLERQAQAAEKYTELKKEERALKSFLQASRYLKLQDKSQGKQATITELELKVEAGVTHQVNIDSTIETERVRLSELGDNYHKIQERYYAIGADIARLEQTIAHSQDRERQLKIDLEQTQRDYREALAHHQQDVDKAQGWESELLTMEPELALLEEAAELSSVVLEHSEEAMQKWQQEWDLFNQRAQAPRQQAEVQQSRIQHLEAAQQRLLVRIEKLSQEQKVLVVGDAEAEMLELRESITTAEEALAQYRKQTQAYSDQLQSLREQEQQIRLGLTAQQGEHQKNSGRLASLEALQQAALGSGDKLSNWLTENNLQNLPRLAASITVDAGWERAVEVVLGTHLQAVVGVGDLQAVARAEANLQAGEFVVYSLGVGDVIAHSLASKVSGQINLNGILGSVLVANTLHEAEHMRATLADYQSVITPEGIWLSNNWLHIVKADDLTSGVLARQKEIEHLQVAIASQEEQLAVLSEQLASTKVLLVECENNRDRLRQIIDEHQQLLAKHQRELTAHTVKTEQVLERKNRVAAEIDDTKEQLELEAEGLAEARAQLEVAIEAMEADTHTRESLLVCRDACKDALDNSRQKTRTDKSSRFLFLKVFIYYVVRGRDLDLKSFHSERMRYVLRHSRGLFDVVTAFI